MLETLSQLHRRNKLLTRLGWLFWLLAFICTILYQAQPNNLITGINAWIKPFKFAASIALFSWTMAWFLHYLSDKKAVHRYSIMVVVVMLIEQGIIMTQAFRGEKSHFNVSSSLHTILFAIMGVAITLLTVWTGYMTYLFFKQKTFTISSTYLWGIRLGMIFFVLFSFEGGLMAQRLAHSVGGPDGSPGLPLLNWSRDLGDLRVAHFFGIHALQLLPLAGRYLTTKSTQLFVLAALYFIMVMVYFVEALLGVPAF